MSVGRNDPCPCGSGEKYKKCCLKNAGPQPEDLFRHRLRRTRNDLIGKILKHTSVEYGEVAILEAWEDFHDGEGDPFDPGSAQLQVFIPWFIYDWKPDVETTQVKDNAPIDFTPAGSFLKSKEGRRLDSLEKEYIVECLKTPFSFFEITQCHPGHGFKLKDIFTEESVVTAEKMGSESAQIGDIIFGKPVTVQNLTTLEACSPILIPPIHKGYFVKIRKLLRKLYKHPNREALQESCSDFVAIYLSFYNASLNPRPPTMANTDGDVLEPQTLVFEIDCPEKTFAGLHHLNTQETKEQILKHGETDSEGKLKRIEFPWLGLGKNSKQNGPIVKGQIFLNRSEMMVHVNSERRAKTFLSTVKKLKLSGVRFKMKTLEPVDQYLKKGARGSKAEKIGATLNDPLESPEILDHITKLNQKHWDNWVNMKVPALGNKTPIHAAKTKNGRELLEALLVQFEREAVARPQPGITFETFKIIRAKLGVEKDQSRPKI